jgi:hypothetical protein
MTARVIHAHLVGGRPYVPNVNARPPGKFVQVGTHPRGYPRMEAASGRLLTGAQRKPGSPVQAMFSSAFDTPDIFGSWRAGLGAGPAPPLAGPAPGPVGSSFFSTSPFAAPLPLAVPPDALPRPGRRRNGAGGEFGIERRRQPSPLRRPWSRPRWLRLSTRRDGCAGPERRCTFTSISTTAPISASSDGLKILSSSIWKSEGVPLRKFDSVSMILRTAGPS